MITAAFKGTSGQAHNCDVVGAEDIAVGRENTAFGAGQRGNEVFKVGTCSISGGSVSSQR
jgi:hypothetical protein